MNFKNLLSNVFYQCKHYFIKDHSIGIDLSDDVKNWLLQESCDTNKSVNQIICEHLKDYIDKSKAADEQARVLGNLLNRCKNKKVYPDQGPSPKLFTNKIKKSKRVK